MAGSVAITGATGFLGWHLIEAFRAGGWTARAIVRLGNARPLPTGADAVESALDAAGLARAVEGCSVVVHCAALTRARNDAAFNAVNVAGTAAVTAAANQTGAAVILISSQAAAGAGTADHPSREDDPPRPLNAYGRSKLASEEMLKSTAKTPWMILRPSAVYGPRDRAFLPIFRMASRGLFVLAADAAMPLTIVYVEDVARAVVRAASSLMARGAGPSTALGAGVDGQTLFVGHQQPTTTEGLLRTLAAEFQKPYRPRTSPLVLLQGLSWVGELSWGLGIPPLVDRDRLAELRASGFVCSVDRAREVLGFTAGVELPDGISRAAAWYREQHWL